MTEVSAQTPAHYIDKHAAEKPGQTFLFDIRTRRSLTYRHLQARTQEVGGYLTHIGVPAHGKVAFLLNNGDWATILFLGVMASGRTIVPLNAVAGEHQLQYVLDHCDAGLVFVSGDHREQLDGLLQGINRSLTVIPVDPEDGPQWPDMLTGGARQDHTRPQEEDAALLLYTSGSTGLPKGAVLSQRAVTQGGLNVAGGHGLTDRDRALCVLPVYHINGAMVTVMAPLVSGGGVVMPERFSARSFWSWIAAYQCTWSSVVPTIIKYLLERADQEPYRFGTDERIDSFRFARSASAPLPAVILEQWEKVFKVPMIETMGLTETAGTIATNPMPPLPRKPGSVGLPYGNDIKIVKQTGEQCAAGEEGELIIRGRNVLVHYYKNTAATHSAFTDGWFRTGDLGRADAQGYLYITGRLKELIIRGGENIAPREIDEILYKHESILEAAAVGVDDENYGQEVVACVVVRDGYSCTEQALKDFCIAAIGEYKSPKKIYFMDGLPKGPSGKILRRKLPALMHSTEVSPS